MLSFLHTDNRLELNQRILCTHTTHLLSYLSVPLINLPAISLRLVNGSIVLSHCWCTMVYKQNFLISLEINRPWMRVWFGEWKAMHLFKHACMHTYIYATTVHLVPDRPGRLCYCFMMSRINLPAVNSVCVDKTLPVLFPHSTCS